jgi:hypothetical protein
MERKVCCADGCVGSFANIVALIFLPSFSPTAMRFVSDLGFYAGAGPSSAAATQQEDLLDDDTLKCAICMQLCERPVTVRF